MSSEQKAISHFETKSGLPENSEVTCEVNEINHNDHNVQDALTNSSCALDHQCSDVPLDQEFNTSTVTDAHSTDATHSMEDSHDQGMLKSVEISEQSFPKLGVEETDRSPVVEADDVTSSDDVQAGEGMGHASSEADNDVHNQPEQRDEREVAANTTSDESEVPEKESDDNEIASESKVVETEKSAETEVGLQLNSDVREIPSDKKSNAPEDVDSEINNHEHTNTSGVVMRQESKQGTNSFQVRSDVISNMFGFLKTEEQNLDNSQAHNNDGKEDIKTDSLLNPRITHLFDFLPKDDSDREHDKQVESSSNLKGERRKGSKKLSRTGEISQSSEGSSISGSKLSHQESAGSSCIYDSDSSSDEELTECGIPSEICNSIVEDTVFPETPTENSVVPQFNRQSKKSVTISRKTSTSTYQRRNTTAYELEKFVKLTRSCSTENYGFHLKGQHPVCISSVEEGSIASTNGVNPNDGILVVNGKDVVLFSHKDVVTLIDSEPKEVCLVLAPLEKITDLPTPTMSGELEKRKTKLRKTWHSYWFELKEDGVLYYYKQKLAVTPSAAIYLKAFSVDKSNEVTNGFRLWKYGLEFMLRAPTAELVGQWVDALNKAIDLVTRTNPAQMVTTVTPKLILNRHAINNPDHFGTLQKRGGSRPTWRTRYCILKNASLYYYSSDSKDVARGVAHFHGYRVENKLVNSSKSHGFTLVPPDPDMREYYFCAKDEETKQRWICAFEDSIKKWINAEDTLNKAK